MLKVIILKKLEVVRKILDSLLNGRRGHQNQMMDEVLANLCSKCFFSFVRSPLGNSYLTSTPSTHPSYGLTQGLPGLCNFPFDFTATSQVEPF